MTKPKLAIAPRKPVSESAAQKLEEELERKSEAIAGATAPNPSPTSDGSKPILVQRKHASKPVPPAKTAQTSAQQSPGVGTRANPRIRKIDGVETRSTSVHLPIELGLRLTMFCARNGRKQSEVLTTAVAELLDRLDR